MSYEPKDYWVECIEIALADHSVSATREQIIAIASDVEGAHDSYGMAFYSPPAGEHYRSEIDQLQRDLKKERAKVVCPDCHGRGRLVYNAGPWGVNSHCSKCNGEGKCSP